MENSPGNLTERGLDRRLKRHLMKARQAFIATCVPGLEAFLFEEVKGLPGVEDMQTIVGGVEFTGTFDLVYEANLRLRCANRVAMRIDSFVARSYPELFNKAKRVAWEMYLGFGDSVAVEVSAKKSRLHHTDRIEESVHSAIGETLRPLGIMPAPKEDASLRVLARMADDRCTLSMDSSGERLYRRGYKLNTAQAPLRETIAAALLMSCQWHKSPIIVDPFCGSGTLPIEAALMVTGAQPGANRSFAFESWPSFQEAKWARLRQGPTPGPANGKQRILASDMDPKAVQAAQGNAGRACIYDRMEITKKDCCEFNTDGQLGKRGLVIANLPYGKRVGEGSNLALLYSRFGKHLRTTCKGWHFGFLVADSKLFKKMGLRARSRLVFRNGGIKVEFVTGLV